MNLMKTIWHIRFIQGITISIQITNRKSKHTEMEKKQYVWLCVK